MKKIIAIVLAATVIFGIFSLSVELRFQKNFASSLNAYLTSSLPLATNSVPRIRRYLKDNSIGNLLELQSAIQEDRTAWENKRIAAYWYIYLMEKHPLMPKLRDGKTGQIVSPDEGTETLKNIALGFYILEKTVVYYFSYNGEHKTEKEFFAYLEAVETQLMLLQAALSESGLIGLAGQPREQYKKILLLSDEMKMLSTDFLQSCDNFS